MKETFIDYYEILNISPQATEKEIRRAYHKKANQYHPDKHIGKNIRKEHVKYYEEKFIKAAEAYETLTSKTKREKYDKKYREYYRNKNQSEKETTNSTKDFNEKNKNIVFDFQELYKEVKKEEEKESLYKRHSILNKRIYNEFYNFDESIPGEIVFSIKQGTIHITAEMFYQLRKLTYLGKEPFTKFIIRNRKLIGTVLLSSILISALSGKNISDNIDDNNQNITSEELTEENSELEITLNRKYEVVQGDTLSEIAQDSGNSVDRIKYENNLDSDLIYIGEKLTIPYTISKENINYYTDTIPVGNKKIQDIASEYETDIKTIISLNKEAILEQGDNYIILSNQIIVPKFITRKELEEKTSSKHI